MGKLSREISTVNLSGHGQDKSYGTATEDMGMEYVSKMLYLGNPTVHTNTVHKRLIMLRWMGVAAVVTKDLNQKNKTCNFIAESG